MRAPFSDRDDIGSGLNDYAGILLDGRGTGSNGVFFIATPRNVQYDSIMDDSTDEAASADPQTWHILLRRRLTPVDRQVFVKIAYAFQR